MNHPEWQWSKTGKEDKDIPGSIVYTYDCRECGREWTDPRWGLPKKENLCPDHHGGRIE